ncbi:hypothetical protein TURU_026114 [Turdus rufiventris]|nr:hypothetical protein TURU_026114 [Turdus rufiventris]
MEFQTRKCLMTAPTQKVSQQLFLAISFPMQPFNTASRIHAFPVSSKTESVIELCTDPVVIFLKEVNDDGFTAYFSAFAYAHWVVSSSEFGILVGSEEFPDSVRPLESTGRLLSGSGGPPNLKIRITSGVTKIGIDNKLIESN